MEQKKFKKILIIIADFYQDIAKNLELGALKKLDNEEFLYVIKRVPGTLEIPTILNRFIKEYDGYVILTCLIKGETDHYNVVKDIAVREIYKIGYSENIAMGTGIITADNYKQAVRRSKVTEEDYGGRAMNACLKLIKILNE
jgi:6,7-dimethyl-8-ribityllumazine synthase